MCMSVCVCVCVCGKRPQRASKHLLKVSVGAGLKLSGRTKRSPLTHCNLMTHPDAVTRAHMNSCTLAPAHTNYTQSKVCPHDSQDKNSTRRVTAAQMLGHAVTGHMFYRTERKGNTQTQACKNSDTGRMKMGGVLSGRTRRMEI